MGTATQSNQPPLTMWCFLLHSWWRVSYSPYLARQLITELRNQRAAHRTLLVFSFMVFTSIVDNHPRPHCVWAFRVDRLSPHLEPRASQVDAHSTQWAVKDSGQGAGHRPIKQRARILVGAVPGSPRFSQVELSFPSTCQGSQKTRPSLCKPFSLGLEWHAVSVRLHPQRLQQDPVESR